MEILKKDIIKEMEEKSRENLNRGIDIAVSILKNEFPFITGWDYKNNPETYRSSIYLVLNADMNLASEFYNSPIRNVYKHAEARVSYPFSPLEISTELNEDEKYELFKVIQKSLLEIYDEIPSELRHEFESYSSEKKEPKELYIEGFIFEKPKENINENKRSEIERNIGAINLILSEINWDGLCEIWVEYNEVDGDYEIRSKSTKRHFDYDNITNELGYLDNTLRSMGLRTYIYTPWYVENCEDEVEFLNESEEETTNYIPIIEEIIEPFKNEDAVCDINVSYDEEDDMYSVYLVLGTEELNDRFYYVDGIRTYRNKLANKIKTEIKSYLPIDNLYVGSYGKPNCGWSPLNESVMGPEYLDLIKDIVEIYKHEDTICDIEVSYDDEDGMYSIYIIFDSEEMLKLRDRGAYARQIRNRMGDDIVKYIPDFLNFYAGSYVRHCKESINENWFKVPSSDYNSLEKIINLEMKEKYSWWKDIKINSLEYIEFSNKHVLIDAEITVDEEWAGNQWREYNPHMEFPGNKGWEDNDEYELVSLGDIIGSNLANEIREIFSETLKYTLNFEMDVMSFRNLYLIFE